MILTLARNRSAVETARTFSSGCTLRNGLKPLGRLALLKAESSLNGLLKK
jgi:hypothetical protein